MIELKPDEIRLWEQVYTAYITTGKMDFPGVRAENASWQADKAVEDRRARFKQGTMATTAYRDPSCTQ